MTPRQEREEELRRRTAREMGKGGRLSLMSAWLDGGRVKMHPYGGGPDDCGVNVYLTVGDVWFNDKRVHYPSERLVAMLALALEAGVDRKALGCGNLGCDGPPHCTGYPGCVK